VKQQVIRVTTRIVAAGVFLLLVAGALVTSTGSGLAVPDWPLSYGRLMPPMVGGIRFEHGHRLVAAAVSTLVGLELGLLLLFEGRKRLKVLGAVAFGAILLQAVLGGLTVKLQLPPVVSSAHACLAQIVFALTAMIALMCSKAWTSGSLFEGIPASDAPVLRPAFRASALASGAIYAQILVGAVMRHTEAGLAIPDFPTFFGHAVPAFSDLALQGVPIHLAHRLGAVVVFVLVLSAARRLGRASSVNPLLGTVAAAWVGLVSIQGVLGALSIWSRKAVPVTVTHLAVGALCWALGAVCTLTVGRMRSLVDSRASSLADGRASSLALDTISSGLEPNHP
jgi:cytochrome c oxidase assembly protein subunit 15